MKLAIDLKGMAEAVAGVDVVGPLMESGALQAAVEVAATEQVKGRLLARDKIPNKLGGTRTNYWLAAADSVSSATAGEVVTVTIAHRGVALHLYGGAVKPRNRSEITGKPIKFLTIPKHAGAHGKTVAMLRALGVELYPGRGGLLRQQGDTRDPERDEMYFRFAKQVRIKPDASVVPSVAEISEGVRVALIDALG